MEILFFVIFLFLILMPLVLGINIPIYKDHRKATGDVINYDPAVRKFVYKISMPKQEIINRLRIKNATDDLSCTFDFERSTILFAEYGSSREYFFQIQECDGFSLLRLEQVPLLGMKSHVPYKLNPFLVSKLNAEIIPFSQYGV